MSGLAVAMPADVVRDVLEGQLGWVFATPVGQPGADRLGIFKSRNVVTAEAAVFGDRLSADVFQSLLIRKLLVRRNNQVLFCSLQLPFQRGWDAEHVVLVGNVLIECLVQIFEHQLFQCRIVFRQWLRRG